MICSVTSRSFKLSKEFIPNPSVQPSKLTFKIYAKSAHDLSEFYVLNKIVVLVFQVLIEFLFQQLNYLIVIYIIFLPHELNILLLLMA